MLNYKKYKLSRQSCGSIYVRSVLQKIITLTVILMHNGMGAAMNFYI